MADWAVKSFEEEEAERKKRKAREEAERQKRKSKDPTMLLDELNTWKGVSPGGAVRTLFAGDRVLAGKHIGEAMNQLFILKNRMKLGKLPALSAPPYILKDGTIILVQSIYGQDQVIIDSPKPITATGATGPVSCIISLIDLPPAIQPMKYPREIHEGEVLGTDYIKTYYTFDVSQCKTCTDVNWIFNFTYTIPVETRHYIDPETGREELDNHLIYSLERPGKGEIITHDEDAGGKYVIWKAYTEASEYSRTGLGIILLTAQIEDTDRKVICFSNNKIEVDCCRKDFDQRRVEIWWEDFGTCQPFIMTADGRICKMPSSVPIWGSMGLRAYSTPYYAARPLYAIPQILGSCIPLTWTATGPIRLYGTNLFGALTYFQILTENIKCDDSVTIGVTDRCGNHYKVHGDSCCESAEPLEIVYTSLEMSCGGSQTLSNRGGCSLPGFPLQWTLTGGGTLEVSDNIIYHAPATNPDCSLNPTITVTDCCGNSASITLSVNCYGLADIAFRYCTQTNTTCDWEVPGNSILVGGVRLDRYDYRCDGTMFWHGSAVCQSFICPSNTGCPSCSNCYAYLVCVTDPPSYPEEFDCGGQACNSTRDLRSDYLKSLGCCPVNPITGLPF